MGELRSDGHGGAAAKWMVTKSETGKKSYSKMSSETHDAEASLSTGPELTTAQIVTANETMDLKFSTAVGHYVSVERWSELNAIPVPVNVETDQYVDDV